MPEQLISFYLNSLLTFLVANNCTSCNEFVQLWQLKQKCVSLYVFIGQRFAHTAKVTKCTWYNLL